MKRILGLAVIGLCTLAFAISCKNDHKQQEATVVDTTYTVTISLKGLDSGALLMSYRIGEDRKTDSAKSTSGVYIFSGKADEPRKARLSIMGDENHDFLEFYLENGRIEISASKDSLTNATAVGTKANDDNHTLQIAMAPVQLRLDNFIEAYSAADKSNKRLVDSLENTYDLIDSDQKKLTSEFVKTHPSSFVSAYEIIEMYSYNPDVQKFDSAFLLLDSAIKVSSIGQKLAGRLAIAKKTDINQIAPDFTMDNVNGKPVTLSSLRGKYLLIDFWASWCGPCRRENPNLVKTYRTYNKKGFEIVGVSFDEPGDKGKWVEAIKKDKLTWLQLSDLKGWEYEAGKLYGISGIPMNFLLDPEGKIIAKGLRGEDLNVKLEEILVTGAVTAGN